jgi:hypothetical protein
MECSPPSCTLSRPSHCSSINWLFRFPPSVRKGLLPVDFTVVSWSLVDWDEVKDREELLMARMRQLDERELAEARAADELEMSRRINKDYFDQHKQLRPASQQLSVGDLVLLFNSAKENSRERKLKLENNWFGPYRITEISNSGYYRLAELDGSPFRESFAGNRLMKFFPRAHEDMENRSDSEDDEEVD